MRHFLRQDPDRKTLGDSMTTTARAMDRALSFPPKEWLDDYNRHIAEEQEGGPKSLLMKTVGGVLVFPPTQLVFGPRQPSVFYDSEGGVPYRGQDRVKTRIDTRIESMGKGDRFKCLFSGPAGCGKTALAWVVAFRLQAHRNLNGEPLGRFFEVLPSQIENKAQLDEFMRHLEPYDIVFIDEVHILKNAVGAEPLYHVLADTGLPRYPLGAGEGWLNIPNNVSWLTATTEPGALDSTTGGALRRRLEPELQVEPPSVDDLALIVADQDMPVHRDAAYTIAERSGGLPWQALLVYEEARAVARCKDSVEITEPHVEHAFEVMGIDENGLLPDDRKVIETLLNVQHRLASGRVVHRMNEAALCAASGIDRGTFKDRVQPKLQRMKLLTTVGGQTLTDKAVQEYGYLVSN